MSIVSRPSTGKPLEHSNTTKSAAGPSDQKGSSRHSNGSTSSCTREDLTQDLRHDPRLLDRIAEAITARGYAGDVTPPLLLYVAGTSRLLERPLNVVVVGESSVGKNATVEAALDLLPPEAVHRPGAASERALIYDDADLRHRHVFFEEADSIPDNGPAASAIRSLITDNILRYSVVEKNASTNRYETRRIEKKGPTGLLTTATRSLRYQMGTRVLEIQLTDDPGQTRAVMRAKARAVSGSPEIPKVDLSRFLALQEWLLHDGERRVVVPFAEELPDLIPATAVRMRRDFPQLLTTIQAVALLYQCQRERTPEGAVIASLEDYAQARRLLAPVFDAVAAEGLTPAIRQTAEAIRPGQDVSISDLAQRLNLAKSTVSWRVKRAIRGGWLENAERRRGHEARVRRANPLPNPTTCLPTVDQVRDAVSCQCSSGPDRSSEDSNSTQQKSHEITRESGGCSSVRANSRNVAQDEDER